MNASTPTALDADVCYRALRAKDVRFDGVFFVGVETTGIYCRPVCPARTPGRERCVFFRRPAEAERGGFRACFRCRPELAPGRASVDSISRLVAAAVDRIEAGALNEASLDDLARDLGVTARHLRRTVQGELGVSPIELAQSRRLALAKQLLHDTSFSMTEVALASGFASIRRFNAAFQARFRRSPSSIRLASIALPSDTIPLTLAYRPPLDWPALLGFLSARAIPGVEHIEGDTYARTVRLGVRSGSIAVAPVKGRFALRAEVSLPLAGGLMPLVARLRRLFDLDAHPATIADHLAADETLRPLVARRPGLRVPGAFDGFEIAVRAILGQQISVKAATTIAGQLAATFGEPFASSQPELSVLFPTPARLAGATEAELMSLGLTGARAKSLANLARVVTSGEFDFDSLADPALFVVSLEKLPGFGPWTAQYVAMRALGAPDAFPEADLGLRHALGGASLQEIRARAQAWSPWRAYACMHLWTSLGDKP